jgi:hypothetical protein
LGPRHQGLNVSLPIFGPETYKFQLNVIGTLNAVASNSTVTPNEGVHPEVIVRQERITSVAPFETRSAIFDNLPR